MFTAPQGEFLLRRLKRNEVILFVGAGFSLDAFNRRKEKLPTGKILAEKIWNFIKMDGDYDGTALQTMYELLLNKGIKKTEIKQFFEETFLVSSFPDYYYGINIPFWYKIYTTNIDNLLEKIYLKSEQKPKILKYPNDEYLEVDKSLESVQIVYLNGKIPCDPEDVIFSRKQYARNTNSLQPLYHQFVSEYATTTTVFLGTSIDEPIFEQYIAARETRKSKFSEHRPQSFLIDPYIPQARGECILNCVNPPCVSCLPPRGQAGHTG